MRANTPHTVSDLQVGDVPKITAAQVASARGYVAGIARDRDDAAQLLHMLGLLPAQIAAQPHLYEPGALL